MTTGLAARRCVPCKGDTPPLRGQVLRDLHGELGPGWQVVDEHHLCGSYRFANFREALDFTSRVGEMAEEQFHHPDLLLRWGRVEVTIYTHKIDGLTESDFVFAAKCDQIRELSPGPSAPRPGA